MNKQYAIDLANLDAEVSVEVRADSGDKISIRPAGILNRLTFGGKRTIAKEMALLGARLFVQNQDNSWVEVNP